MNTYLDKLIKLNQILLEDLPSLKSQADLFNKTENEQEDLFRALRNIREPGEISKEYLKLESAVLEEQKKRKGIIDINDLSPIKEGSPFYLFQGDITRLNSDAIVNAANSALLGCFIPLHNCIDNAIHSAAGVELRNECNELMQLQQHPEATGKAKITNGYNLPSRHVIHTVGPIVENTVTKQNKEDLKNSYLSILELADQNNLESVAFCCISTGVFHFPNDLAAEIAIDTVTNYLKTHPDSSIKKVIFNVLKDLDKELYEQYLKKISNE